MAREERLYRVCEIALARGLSKNTINGRRKARGIPVNREGYTLEQVKIMMKRRPRGAPRPSRQKAAELREKLKNDGYL